jgi:hypothetical protein
VAGDDVTEVTVGLKPPRGRVAQHDRCIPLKNLYTASYERLMPDVMADAQKKYSAFDN